MTLETMQALKVRSHLEPSFRSQLSLSLLAQYDLTQAEKHAILLPTFQQFDSLLSVMAYPPCQDTFTVLQERGIQAILNLSDIPYPSHWTTSLPLYHIPTQDFCAPTLYQIRQALDVIVTYNSIVMHCVAGLGRTGTILACYLVSKGQKPDAAISDIRAWRNSSIETVEQEQAIYEFSTACINETR